MKYDFNGKRIAVVGIARSGMAAAEVLTRLGAVVTLYDSKSADMLETQLAWASDYGIPCITAADTMEDADIAIVSPGVRWESPIMESIRIQGIELWGEIEAAYRISKAPILAVTGTNGKTTTALLLADMIRASGRTTFAAGNIAAGALAMPLISAAEAAGADDAIVAEISSFQLETIKEFRPAVAAILNITPDHQDRQTWDEYVSSKWRIFENLGTAETAVLSHDVPEPVSMHRLPPNMTYFDELPLPSWVGDMHLPGAHNRLNLLAASAMAQAFGVAEEAVKEASLAFHGVIHRLEFVDEIDGVKYINNSMCTNNAAFANSLEAIPQRKIVIAGGVFKGGDMSLIAEAVGQNNVKLLVAFGRSGKDIAEIVRQKTGVEVDEADTLKEAFGRGSSSASGGDIVILNPGCASFDQFRDFEDRGDQFKCLVNDLRKRGGK